MSEIKKEDKEKSSKTGKEVGRGHPPKEHQFKKGYDPRRGHRPKGSRDFETYFILAWKEVAEALKLGKEPDRGKIEILKIGFKEMFKGNYQFWKDFVERLFGKTENIVKLGADEELKEIIVKIVKPKEDETVNL